MTIFNLRVTGSLPAGDVWNSGFHVQSSFSVDTLLSAISNWIDQFWNGHLGGPGFGPLCAPGVTVTAVAAYQLDAAFPYKTVASRYEISAFVGTSAHNSLPQNTSPLISLRTLQPGAKGRGRMYLPPVDVTQVTVAGELTSDAVAAIEAAALGAWTDIDSSSVTPVIFNKASGLFNRIDNYNVPNVLTVQRRRVNKVTRLRPPVAMP